MSFSSIIQFEKIEKSNVKYLNLYNSIIQYYESWTRRNGHG